MAKLTSDLLPVLQEAFDTSADAVYMVDRDFNLIWVNRAFRLAFRYRPRHRLPCFEVTKMGICRTNACVLTRCLQSGTASSYQETEVAGAKEPDATCLSGGRAVYDVDSGELVVVIGTMRDNSAEVRLHRRYGAVLDAERNHKEILESKVATRTAELVAANATLHETNLELARSRREVADILENISQAILTIDEELLVGQEYSRHAERVFGRSSLVGVPFGELIAPEATEERSHKELVEWLKLVFHSPGLDWDVAQSMVEDEYVLKRQDGRVSELRFEFEPIREEQRVKRMMVLVEDLTEKRELQRLIDAKQQEIDESLDHLSELARLDPELYEAIFEEATQIVERAASSLAAIRTSDEVDVIVDRMFRDMHNLKGNAMAFGMVRVAAKAHWVEDAFEVLRDSSGAPTEELIVAAEEKVRELGDLVERIQTMANRVLAKPASRDTGAVRSQNRLPTVEVDVERLETLVAWAAANLSQAQHRQELIARIRSLALVPLARLYARFPKMVADLSETLGKKLHPPSLMGADLALDGAVFNTVGNVLVHLLRNCVDHGIESPEVRLRAGRPEYGTVSIAAYFRDDSLRIEVRDDGAGIDEAALIEHARALGLLKEDEVPETDDALQLIFHPGLSTAKMTSDVSGRGVGMDSVRTQMQEIGGTIHVESTLGEGTRFTLIIPTAVAMGEKR